jgi:hypothetical protein
MDCYLPADFFLADDARRVTRGDYELGADAHVHLDAPAFVTGLRDWAQGEPVRPRGAYPGSSARRDAVRGRSDECRREQGRMMQASRAGSGCAQTDRMQQPVDAEWRPV